MPTLLYPNLCPDCGHDLKRSRRRGMLENLITMIFRFRLLRCHRCRGRFYVSPALVFRTLETEDAVSVVSPKPVAKSSSAKEKVTIDEAI